MKNPDEILRYFPNSLYENLSNIFKQNPIIWDRLQEIRIRVGRQIILKLRDQDILLEYVVSQSEILQMLERLCENSIYAYKNQICEGFITVKGGHRVGIAGSCVIENGKIINVKYISSLNFRIAREIINCSTNILREVIDKENETIFKNIAQAYIKDGVQYVHSELSSGKYPDITVRAGEPVEWEIEASEDNINGCNYKIFLQDFGLEHTFTEGKNIIKFTPEQAGTYTYTCWMGMITGKIHVENN